MNEIDIKASRNRARKLLKGYRTLARIGGQSLTNIQSPKITDMPRAKPFSNGLEERMTKQVDAQRELDNIQRALEFLPQESFEILYYSYFGLEYLSGWDIADKIGVDNDKTVNWRKNKALLEFAEAYCNGKLLVFRSEEG